MSGFRHACVSTAPKTSVEASLHAITYNIYTYQELRMSKLDGRTLPELLDHASEQIRKYVVFQSTADADAIALWVAGTYLMDHWDLFPKLMINSPERECGKTTTLEVIEGLAHKAVLAAHISPAALSRLIDAEAPTLLIDEADLTVKHNDKLRALLNAGHTKHGAKKILCEQNLTRDWVRAEQTLWCPQAIAGIGDFPDTLMSRSIVVTLRRKARNEAVEHLRPGRFVTAQEPIRTEFGQWVGSINPEDLEKEPTFHPDVFNRAQDNWRPLLQIASLAGGRWIQRANKALGTIELERKKDLAVSTSTELLLDLRELLADFTGPEIASSKLHQLLVTKPETDWSRAQAGKAISAKWLAGQLKSYGIRPQKRASHNAYFITDLSEVFERYLPPMA